jgi:hypothetical protein
LPVPLLEAFDPVEGQGVVCFVGSGPSIDAGLPTWDELLRACARRLGVEGDIGTALNAGRYLEVAQYLASPNGERALQECVADLLRKNDRSPGDIHRLIVSIPFAGIVTTNYDLLLSDADIGRFFELPVTHQTSAFSSLPRRRFMFHLHGHINDPATIILAKSGYDRFALGHSEGALQFVRTLFHTRTVLFLGFGFRDENVDALLRDMIALEVSVGWSVFALVPVAEPERPEKVLDTALRQRGVYPIYLEARTDHGVLALTQWLLELQGVVKRIIHARSNPVSRAPQAAVLTKLSPVLDAGGYGTIVQSALRDMAQRPDLVQWSEDRKERIRLLDLLDKVDVAEMRSLLIKLNRTRRHAYLEDALACLPPG